MTQTSFYNKTNLRGGRQNKQLAGVVHMALYIDKGASTDTQYIDIAQSEFNFTAHSTEELFEYIKDKYNGIAYGFKILYIDGYRFRHYNDIYESIN